MRDNTKDSVETCRRRSMGFAVRQVESSRVKDVRGRRHCRNL